MLQDEKGETKSQQRNGKDNHHVQITHPIYVNYYDKQDVKSTNF
jgi:hypothetical protein